MMTAAAAGSSRRVAIDRSMETHVSTTPIATNGSARSPLLEGSQNARNTSAAVHTTILSSRTAAPRRGRISRLMTHHVTTAAASVGNRTHALAVEACANQAITSV
jgi:hypothetical protein